MFAFNNVQTWQKDSDSPACPKCRIEFGFWVWRHHCRCCGRVLCDICSSHYIMIPYNELCHNCPSRVNIKDKQRACWECADRIRSQYRRQNSPNLVGRQNLPNSNVIQTVNAHEFDRKRESKLFFIQLPQDSSITTGTVLRVDLGDGRMCHITVPAGVYPGGSLYVRCNEINVVVDVPIITDVYVCSIDALCDIIEHQDSRSNQYQQHQQQHRNSTTSIHTEEEPDVGYGDYYYSPDETRADMFIECPACTYHNSLKKRNCIMCGVNLFD